jgi:cysteine-rich repeat protein
MVHPRRIHLLPRTRLTLRRHLAIVLTGLVVASCQPAAALDVAGRCAHDKLRAHRMAASAHLYCERAYADEAEQRELCLERAVRRLSRRLAAVEATALQVGFRCPAGAEALGLDGALSWTTRFVHDRTETFSATCMREVTTAAQRLSSGYHRCLSSHLRGVFESEAELGECAERMKQRFAAAWQRTGSCTSEVATDAAGRILAEVNESAARVVPACGDRHVTGFEQCDDGNTASSDGCNAACETETCERIDGEVRCIACADDAVPAPTFESCQCPQGFSGSPGACTDVDECTNGQGQCAEGQTCVNLAGTWACAIACTAEAFHAALETCGAPSGAIAFDCADTVIDIPAGDATKPRDIDCDDLTIDGAGRNVAFQLDPLCWQTPLDPAQCPGGLEEDGTCFCPDVDSGEPFLLLRGDGNVVRDLTVRGFFEGIPVRGRDNLVEKIRFERMCDDAFGSVAGGVGNVFRDLVVRDGCDKCSENAGPLAAADPDPRVPQHFHAILRDVDFEDCATPVRVTANGRFLLDGVRMTGGNDEDFPCDGPRFSSSSASERVAIYMKDGLVDGCRRGIRFGNGTDGVLTDLRISGSGLRALRVAGNSRVSVEGVTMESNGGDGSSEAGFGGAAIVGQGRLDLGGGTLTIDGAPLTSRGDNSLCFNVAPDGSDRDLDNGTATSVSAEAAWWCSLGSPDEQITGPADFDPALERAPLRYRGAP